ncbi:MAG: UDP-N-acetylmuramoyl-L-alanyl-D-glutamate--2,6-diaminopimelate ligase [Intrasporangium sp.]|uniref:UDP-N-acetylmuramoyl-L-alanyl-D-glutamate--2, 6-diaminopimelate ligase n=1 Tax=Intrasporangium sp. TaxID=1925024 RepID=UPI002648C0B3|nr:UDP-N-acetylmuramoyl-L-alanyl-D-glutamate--2,6-diaminopimelate ligase [Intrasporangium sp.]MDN5795241.1 UDP-N-acetylmuramoyl-L-alanyl-D-glutamate--2,6-diaminopimelate ligase [Intrasporangium sp.]
MSPPPIRPRASGRRLADLSTRVGRANPSADVLVTGVTLDSRTVCAGDLYAALPGFNVHGATFAAQAVRSGAVAVLTDPEGAAQLRDVSVPVLVVDRPRELLGGLAAAVYGDPADEMTMVGITGTNGKTTTAYLLESALRAHGLRTGLIGTVETRIGPERIPSVRTTPESPELHAILAVMRERGVDACVMEVSSHALALHRVDGVVYDLALFTNLSQDHLDFHGSMEQYFAAKAALFTPTRSRRGIVCVDDEWGRRLASAAGVPVTTFSTSGAPADWSAQASGDDIVLRSRAQATELHLVSHLPGSFNVANTCLAALALLCLGYGPAEVDRAMAHPPEVPGRMQIVTSGPGTPRCIVDFAHTPDAVDAALAALRPSTTGRLVAVLGAGGDRDRGKRPDMGAAAARQADVVVVTDDNPRSEDPAAIRAAVRAGADEAVRGGHAAATEVIDGGTRTDAITGAVADAVQAARESGRIDTVVVLGKGHESGQEVGGVVRPFDDREAVRLALVRAGLHTTTASTTPSTTTATTTRPSSGAGGAR